MSVPPSNDPTVAYQPGAKTAVPQDQLSLPGQGATIDLPSSHAGTPQATEFVKSPISMPSEAISDSSLLRRIEIPGYEILEELGRGGMGVVYKARQIGLNRLVAIKMILAAEHAGREHRQRFQAEAESVAQLQHPNIVQIYEVNEISGRPFFSLEFVDGGNLSQAIAGKPQNPRHAAALIQTLANAMAAAHALGIIHRDLKPANILLSKTAPTGDSGNKSIASNIFFAQHPYGIPKITDFGLAKRLESATGQTQSGAIMGTPAYMAPEQAAGHIKQIGPSTDVYALGAILYEMLTGAPPFESESPLELILKVIRDEPERLRIKNPKIPRDLEIITLKCLEKKPEKRYASGLELSDDLKKFLDGDTISARAATRSEKVRKWIRSHPTYSGMILLGALSLVVLVGFGLIYNAKLQKALALAQEQRDKLGEEQNAALERGIRLTVQNGTQYLQQGDLMRALPLFAEALRLENGVASREGMHRVRLGSVLRQCPMLVRAWFHEGKVRDAAFSPDGFWVAAACWDNHARLYSLKPEKTKKTALAFEHPAAVTKILFSPDGKWLATACADGHPRIWSLQDQKSVEFLEDDGEEITSLSFSPDSKLLLSTSTDGTARIFDITLEEELSFSIRHSGPITHGEFAATGSWFLTCSVDQTARVWDSATGKPVSPVLAMQGPIIRAHFSPTADQVVTASSDKTCRVWTVKTGEPYGQIIRLGGSTSDCGFSPAGNQISTANLTGHARIWNLATKDFRPMVMKHEAPILCEMFSPDGQMIATGSEDNAARVWNVISGDPITPPLRHNGSVYRVCFSPSGSSLLTASDDGGLRLWELQEIMTHEEEFNLEQSNKKMIYSPDRRYVMVINGSLINIMDSASAKVIGKPIVHNGPILSAGFTPDGEKIFTASADRTAQIWSTTSGEPIGEPMRHGSEILFASLSPDGKMLATASSDNTARVWDVQTNQSLVPPLKHNGTVDKVIFNSDGSCVVTHCIDDSVRIWDTKNGEMVSPVLKPTGWVQQALESAEKQQSGWDLAPDLRSTDELVLISRWLSGCSVDKSGTLIPLDASSLKSVQDDLTAKYGDVFEREVFPTTAWHEYLSLQAEKNKDWFAVTFHLKQILSSKDGKPNAHYVYRLGNAYAELGDWQKASENYRAAIKLGKEDQKVLIAATWASRAINDKASFQSNLKKLVDQAGESVHGKTASAIAWICLLDSCADSRKFAKDMINRVGHEPTDHQSKSILLAASLYRDGKPDSACELLLEANPTLDGLDIPRAALVMALCESGKSPKEAQRWFRASQSWRDKNEASLNCFEKLSLDLLREELEIQMNKAPTPPKSK